MNVIHRNMTRKLDKCLLQYIQWKILGRTITNTGQRIVFNMKDQIDALRIELKPPVGNKMLHNGDLQIMFVGGPNHRSDFHLEHGQELFIQLEGDMDLDIIERNIQKTVRINEGEIFLLPGGVPHSPRRYKNTVGLVFERKRKPYEQDGLLWFVPNTLNTILYHEYFHCTDLGTQLKPIIERFHSSEEYKTQVPGNNVKNCKLPPPILIDSQAQCQYQPRALSIFSHSQKLFSTESDFLVDVIVGPTQYRLKSESISETFMWYMHSEAKNQKCNIRGMNATVHEDEKKHSIEPNSVILLTNLHEVAGQDTLIDIPEGGKLLSVKFNRI